MSDFIHESMDIWAKGGWLMLPLFALTVFIYYAVMDLLLRLSRHFLIRSKYHKLSDVELSTALRSGNRELAQIVALDARNVAEARRHFEEVRNEYLPIVNRRIRFLAVLITTGPLVGLLGTVAGMLTTFNGMASSGESKFASVVSGVSEALITTQGGLIISIPAFVMLSLIVQRRNTLERCISRLEQYSIRMALRKGVRNQVDDRISGKSFIPQFTQVLSGS
ncbi:MotA/TolQ/ExbB proton channel family protein [Puniceicoccaceae bacterium K14]|nr:MotA/TolQ/ExbB proton channel family protein [Puniceicoccaceae bacterium K14]